MDADVFENGILSQYTPYCAKAARQWLARYHLNDNLLDDAIQCARLGFLLYLRQRNITRAEDVGKNGTSPYWYIHNALCDGIIMKACAPCGIHRPHEKTKVKFTAVPHEVADSRMEYATRDDERALAEAVVSEYMDRLTPDERQMVRMLLDGMKPGEIMKRLGIKSSSCYHYRMVKLRNKWAEE